MNAVLARWNRLSNEDAEKEILAVLRIKALGARHGGEKAVSG